MSLNVEITRTGNESPLATIRKFSRKVQGTGLVKAVRKRRYFERQASKVVKKKRALKRLKRRAEYHQLLKEGKVTEAPRRGGFNRAPQTTSKETVPASQARFGENTPIAR